MVFRTIFLPGDGVRLVADAIGDPAAPPVLFLHGGGQSRRSWRGAARRVAEAGYHGISIDMRGHGDSEWAPDGRYDLGSMAGDLRRVLRHLGRPAVLAGASRGGQVALVAAADLPDHAATLLLADVIPQVDPAGVAPISRFMQASTGGYPDLQAAADALAGLPGRARPADPGVLARVMRRGDDGRLYWQWDPRMADPAFINPPAERALMEQAAARLRCPVLLVRAEHSEIMTDEGVAAFQHLTPQLQVRVARGVGHMFTSDQNDLFALPLLECLSALHSSLSSASRL